MNLRLLQVAALTALATIGCNRNEAAEPISAPEPSARQRAEPSASQRAEPSAPQHAEPRVAADNTEKNERDRTQDTLTPVDQSESEADRSITQQIRQGVVGTDEASMAAKNVKIITVDGVVTLRGPVETAKEKAKIGALAKKVDGVKRVENQLEIAAK